MVGSSETEWTMTALDQIAAALAAPKTHCVTTVYACGKTRIHDVRSLGAVNNYAKIERAKIGRDLIDRETGATVRVVAVTVDAI